MTVANYTGKVLVTGGTGYLAGWIIAGLLRNGYQVRTTLRNPGRETEVAAAIGTQVESLDGLSFARTDLLKDEGWSAAVAGCEYVMHVASPMGQGAPRGTDLVTPAREGTLRVLKAAHAGGVRQVVLTSSGVAAQSPSVPQETQPVANEETWTDLNESGVTEYVRSKTLAERAAWDFMKQHPSEMALTTVLPGLILGPVMAKSVSGSLEVISRLMTGTVPALPHIGFGITHTLDLVDLHLRTLGNPLAVNRRFIGVGDFLWMKDIAAILRRELPEHAAKITSRRLPDWLLRVSALFQEEARQIMPMLGKRREFDASNTFTQLQWRPRPAVEAVTECARSLIESHLV